jgi:hypothetical protein
MRSDLPETSGTPRRASPSLSPAAVRWGVLHILFGLEVDLRTVTVGA